jgi:gliding motility-associated-like protein
VVPSKDNINTYQVTVTDECGNTASDQVVVTVNIDCKLTIPNVFTPNGDGFNDIFLIKGIGIKVYSATIYDRWGLKVYESNDISQSWDGKNVEDGTYYYIIKAESASGKQYNEKGYVLRIAK